MSTHHVTRDILHNIHSSKLTVSILDTIMDIDTYEDAVKFLSSLGHTGKILCPHTWHALQTMLAAAKQTSVPEHS